jgi:murein DD-endopeptidase MepM/ murein hydrolase activator NlpD
MACLGLVVAFALSVGLGTSSSADPSGDKKKVDAGIAQLRTALEGTSQDLATAFLNLQRTTAQLPGARKALTIAAAAQSRADLENQAMTTALAVAQANAASATDALGRTAAASQAAQDELGNLVRDDYMQGDISGLSIALQATSPQDFTNRMVILETVTQVRRATLRGLDTVRAQGRASQSHLVAVRQQVAALKVRAEAALAQATAARESAAAAKANLDLLSSTQTHYAAVVASKKAVETRNLSTLQAQSDALTRELAARAQAARDAARAAGAGGTSGGSGSGGSAQTSGTGFLSYPLSAPVSSEFGMRFDPVMRTWSLHAGIDFAAGCGTPVHAAAAGDVIMATPESASGGYGNRLIIDHGIQRGVDLTTTYNHLTSFVVTSGHVARGQVVAYSGTTGFSTGCHLHFETREDGVPVNPRLWL